MAANVILLDPLPNLFPLTPTTRRTGSGDLAPTPPPFDQKSSQPLPTPFLPLAIFKQAHDPTPSQLATLILEPL